MNVVVSHDPHALAHQAAQYGAALIRQAIAAQDTACIILATGVSQLEMLGRLVAEPDIPWHRVTAFHLDEYVNLPITHPASFRLYLWQRFASRLTPPKRSQRRTKRAEPVTGRVQVRATAVAGGWRGRRLKQCRGHYRHLPRNAKTPLPGSRRQGASSRWIGRYRRIVRLKSRLKSRISWRRIARSFAL